MAYKLAGRTVHRADYQCKGGNDGLRQQFRKRGVPGCCMEEMNLSCDWREDLTFPERALGSMEWVPGCHITESYIYSVIAVHPRRLCLRWDTSPQQHQGLDTSPQQHRGLVFFNKFGSCVLIKIILQCVFWVKTMTH